MLKKIGEVCPALIDEYAYLVRMVRGERRLSPQLMAQEWAALIVLAVTLVVYRTFRERLPFDLDCWLAHAPGRQLEHCGRARRVCRAVVGCAFAVRNLSWHWVCFRRDSRLYPRPQMIYAASAGVVIALLAGYAAMRALLWPDSLARRSLFLILYRLIALAAGFVLIRYRWARAEIGPWLLASEHAVAASRLEWRCIRILHLPRGERDYWRSVAGHQHALAGV